MVWVVRGGVGGGGSEGSVGDGGGVKGRQKDVYSCYHSLPSLLQCRDTICLPPPPRCPRPTIDRRRLLSKNSG